MLTLRYGTIFKEKEAPSRDAFQEEHRKNNLVFSLVLSGVPVTQQMVFEAHPAHYPLYNDCLAVHYPLMMKLLRRYLP